MFEIFCLTEDRRHERDPRMQGLKELFAWGGCDPPSDVKPSGYHTASWPVHDEVFNFVVDGYLPGLGGGVQREQRRPGHGHHSFPKEG